MMDAGAIEKHHIDRIEEAVKSLGNTLEICNTEYRESRAALVKAAVVHEREACIFKGKLSVLGLNKDILPSPNRAPIRMYLTKAKGNRTAPERPCHR